MKTESTDLDREAAQLFTLAPGMRVFVTRARWLETGRIITSDDAEYRVVCESNASALLSTRPDALDADDPATVGAMLAQVEEAAGTRVDLVWAWRDPGVVDYVVQWRGDTDLGESGPTRGAALVAAMRELRRFEK